MAYGFLDIAITPTVRAAEEAMGSADTGVDVKGHREFDRFPQHEVAFIADRVRWFAALATQKSQRRRPPCGTDFRREAENAALKARLDGRGGQG